MAVSITQQPTTPNAAYTSLLYVVSGSGTTTNPQYSYVMDIYESGSTTRLNRYTQIPNPEGVATFDVSRFLQSQLDYDNNWKTNGKARYINAIKDFTIKFGEQYSTSVSSSITVYPDLTSGSIRVFPAVVDPNNGSSYNFNTSSFNSGNTYLTNFPGAQTTTNIPEPKGYPYIVDSKDYFTVTEFEDTLNTENTLVSGYHFASGSVTPYRTFQVLLPNPDPSASLEDRQFLTAGIGPKNISEFDATASASIASGETNLLFTQRDPGGVIVLLNDKWDGSSGISGSSYDFQKTIQPLGTEYIQFAFVNEYGFYDYYNVYSPLKRESSLDRNTVSLPKVDYSSLTSIYSVENGGDTSYYTDINDNYSITTQWLDKEIANWLEELLESPEVFVKQDNEFVPVVITDKNYVSNQSTARNKLFQYTINFKPSNGRDLVSTTADCPKPYPSRKARINLNVTSSLTDGLQIANTRIDPAAPISTYNVQVSEYPNFITGTKSTFRESLELSGSISNVDIVRSDGYFTSSFGPTSMRVEREVYHGTTLLDSTSSLVNNFTGSDSYYNFFVYNVPNINLYENDITVNLNFSEFSTTPIGSPTWYYDSQQVIVQSGWDDTTTVGRNFPGNNTPETFATRIRYKTNQTLGGYTGDWWEVDPEETTTPFFFNKVWTNGNNGSAAGLTGSNFTLQSWVYINEFSEIDGSTPRSVFFSLSGDRIINNQGTRLSVGSRQSGSNNVLSVTAYTFDTGSITQLYPEQIIETGSWYQISLVQDGTNFNDVKVYVNDQTAFYSPTRSVDMNISGAYQYEAGTYDNDKVLSGSIANVICYATSSLTQEQIATNYSNINNYLSI
jgi:hypothetical protein